MHKSVFIIISSGFYDAKKRSANIKLSILYTSCLSSFQLPGFGEGGIAFSSATDPPESKAFVIPGIGILWINLDGLVISLDGFIELALGF
jgi:hypothetical protein